MLNDKMAAALNKQFNYEMSAAYAYLAMAAYFQRANLAGFASWMMKQHQEEIAHAMKLFGYIHDRGGKVELEGIAKPQVDFASVREVFKKSLELEKTNTAMINDLFTLAVESKDYATQSHLKWFLDEQVEEEKIMHEVLGLLDIAGDDRAALLTLNREVAARTGGK
ncbi:MAG: ferritin [Planctomycetes bacterium]|nr:ferritin [Planctomycetota bacterium]